jgi:hypothetical protein
MATPTTALVPQHALCGTPYTPEAAIAAARSKGRQWRSVKCAMGCGARHVVRVGARPDKRRRPSKYAPIGA